MDKADPAPGVRVAGVGLGPSNLALAVALEEAGIGEAAFFERQPEFGWHRGLLLQDARMQVHFLKDLVSQRNPTSPYTFVAYLHARGRLAGFVNSKAVFPLRTEFHDYLEWVAARFAPVVSYGFEVVELKPVFGGATVGEVDVIARRTGDTGAGQAVARAANVVLSTGLTARMPDGVVPGERVWHSSSLLSASDTLARLAPRRLAVVGAGQSAAESVRFLHAGFPDAEVHAIFARYGYSVADNSPFANGIFDPRAVDVFFGAPAEVKAMLLDYHSGTNYSVVEAGLAEDLYDRAYQEAVLGRQRLWIHNTSRIRAVRELPGHVEVDVEHLPTGARSTVEVDAMICATGYVPADPVALLGQLAAECKRDGMGRLVVGRDYRVVTSDAVRCGIFLHGGAVEHTHGLSAGLLSNVAVRAGEIVRALQVRS